MVGSKLVGLRSVDPGASYAPEPGIYSRKAERIFIKLGAIREAALCRKKAGIIP
jgi:hypothetical protein